MIDTRYDLTQLEAALLHRGIISIFDEIDELVSDYVSKALIMCYANGCPPLQIQFNSPGGNVIHSLMIHDALAIYPGETTGIVIGKAHSGANLILQGCNKRFSTENSVHLVHDLSGWHPRRVLRRKKLRDEHIKSDNDSMRRIYKIYRDRTGLSQRTISKLFDKEEMLTAQKALKLGIIDGVILPGDPIIQAFKTP